jgi:plasmid stability protein
MWASPSATLDDEDADDSIDITMSETARKRQLIVRDVPSEVVAALKRRAVRHGRSAEAEHRVLLRDALEREMQAASFKAALASMPDVGRDDDFAIDRDLPRAVP